MFKRSILNTWVQVMAKVVTVLISLVTTAILTRKLGTTVYGSYTLVSSVFLILDSLADFGTKIIGVREAADKEGKEREKIFGQVAFLRLFLSFLAFLIGLLMIFVWSGFEGIRLASIVSLSMIFLTSIGGSLEVVFQTKLRMDLKVLTDIIYPLLFVLILLIWPTQIGLMWVFGMYLLTRLVSLVVGLGLIKKMGINFNLGKIDFNFLKKFLLESWPMGIYLIVFSGYDRVIDSMLIQKYMGLAQLAYYGLGYKIYSNLISPAYFLINSVFPLMSGKNYDKKKIFWWTAGLMFLGLVVLIPLSYFLAPWIVQVLAGDGYAPSIMVLRILLLALIFSYGGHLIGFTLIAKGGQKEILVISLGSLVVNILLNLWIVPRFGIYGAAWVTAITEANNCIWMAIKLWNRR